MTSTNPVHLAACLMLSLQLLLFLLIFRMFAKIRSLRMLNVLVVMSPAAMGFVVLNSGLSKEILLYIAIAGLALGLDSYKNVPTMDVWLAAYLSFFVLLIVLSHEPSLMYAPYVVAALVIANISTPRLIQICALPLCLGLIGFLLVSYHHGNQEQASLICDSVRDSAPGICDGSIAYIAKTSQQAHQHVVDFNKTFRLYAGLIGAFAFAPFLLFFRTRTFDGRGRRNFIVIAIGALLSSVATVPIFYFGLDWHRWMAIHGTCVMLLFLWDAMLRDGAVEVKLPRPWMVGFSSLYVLGFSVLLAITHHHGLR